MVLLMSMSRLSSPMVSKDFTEVSSSLPLVSSSTVACTSASMTHSSHSSLERMLELLFLSSLDGVRQVLKNEGFMSLMKGAGANILRGVAGAGV